MKIDEIDIIILRKLVENAKVSLKELAESTGLAVSSIHTRLTRLISQGIIEKFTILIDPNKCGYITVIILLYVENPKISKIAKKLKEIENVVEIFKIAGKSNMILKVIVKDLNELEDFLEKISKIDGIKDFEYLIVIRKFKEDLWKPSLDKT